MPYHAVVQATYSLVRFASPDAQIFNIIIVEKVSVSVERSVGVQVQIANLSRVTSPVAKVCVRHKSCTYDIFRNAHYKREGGYGILDIKEGGILSLHPENRVVLLCFA